MMAVVNLYYAVVILIGAVLFCFPLRISGLIQPPTGVSIKAVDGSDFVIISWNYQVDAEFYRIFFRSFQSIQGNSSNPPEEVGPMSVYCLPDNTTCSYCVSNINRAVSCNTFNSKYQAPLLESKLDFEELVSVKVEACSDIFPDTCENQSEWKNYTIPPGAPSPVRNVRARPLSSKTVEVTWSPPNHTRGTIVIYSVLYKTANRKEMGEVFSKHVTKGILKGLSAKATYKIWVTASTADREGERSDLVTVETYEDECASSPCQYNGKCHVDRTSYKCECSGAWEGTACNNPKGFVFENNKCIDARDNKPSLHVNVTLEFCAANCRENSSCKSFEYGLGYGSSGTLVSTLKLQDLGQCKIQSMDTKHNQLKSCYYDYYEKKAPVSAGSHASSPNMVLFGTFSLLIFMLKR